MLGVNIDAYRIQLYDGNGFQTLIYTKTGSDFGSGLGCFTLPSAARNKANSAKWNNCFGEGTSSCAQIEFYSNTECGGTRLGIWQTPTERNLVHDNNIESVRISRAEECKSCN